MDSALFPRSLSEILFAVVKDTAADEKQKIGTFYELSVKFEIATVS